ncbi:MAG: hypothetical protein ACK5M7_19120 [Draconibacterium sp.]
MCKTKEYCLNAACLFCATGSFSENPERLPAIVFRVSEVPESPNRIQNCSPGSSESFNFGRGWVSDIPESLFLCGFRVSERSDSLF